MVEAELLIGNLRGQVRHMQSLLNYLESRQQVQSEDFSYSAGRLRELIARLKELERFSCRRGDALRMRASWMN
jgi:hypothetical protein